MIKIIYPDSNQLHDNIASIVPVHSRGVDSDWIEKRASLGHLFEDIKPKDSNHSLIHLIAMGATDMYGPNRNGDSFYKHAQKLDLKLPDWQRIKLADGSYHEKNAETFKDRTETGLYDRYKTFEKFANVYKHHKNKPHRGDKIWGSVKAAAYNEPMERVELLAEVNNDEWKDDLQKLAEGKDTSWSMACIVNPQTPVMTSTGYKAIVDVQIGDLVLTHKGNWRKVTGTPRRRYSGKIVNINLRDYPLSLQFTSDHPLMGSLSKSHMEAVVKAAGGTNDISKVSELLYKPSDNAGADWIHAGHFEALDYLMLLTPSDIPEYTPIDNPSFAYALGEIVGAGNLPRDQANALKLFLGSTGRGVYPGLYNSSHVVRAAFIGGILDGVNSSIVKNAVEWLDYEWSVVTAIRDLCASIGIFARMSIVKVDEKIVHQLIITDNYCADLVDFSDNISGAVAQGLLRVPESQTYNHNAYHAMVIRTVKFEDVTNIPVYNLEIEADESYTVAGIVVHNCKVKGDICSVCGHFAKTRGEYCDHLSNDITKLAKDGHVISAVNEQPTFFDISRVNRPADRIALGLVKAAGELTSDIDPDVVKLYSDIPALDILAASQTTKVANRLNILKKMAEIEKTIAMKPQAVVTANGVKPLYFDNSKLKDLAAKHDKTAQFIDSLNRNDVVLPLRAFSYLLFGNNEKIASIVDEAEKNLSLAIELAVSDPEKVCVLDTYSGTSHNDGYLNKIALSLVPDYGIALGPMRNRLTARIARGESVELNVDNEKKADNLNNSAKELLKQYISYKVAFVEDKSRYGMGDEYIERVVIHNLTQ